MCIALISTAHPVYALILIDNRDEFLHRPTAPANWWPDENSHVLGARDLAREVHGTWLGITKQGRIAVLTNYRENSSQAVGVRSRGAIVNGFLGLPPECDETTKGYLESLIAEGDAQKAGGFSLACGHVGEPLAVFSNRVSAADGITWIAKRKGETVGLSNTAFEDRSWPKIINGEKLMKEAINTSYKTGESEDELIQRLLKILSIDTLPRLHDGADLESYLDLLRESIFIPVIGNKDDAKRAADELASSNLHDKVEIDPNSPADRNVYMKGLYGTQKQTVVLVHESGRVKFFERTLYNDATEAIPIGEGDRVFEFAINE